LGVHKNSSGCVSVWLCWKKKHVKDNRWGVETGENKKKNEIKVQIMRNETRYKKI
jgi:hypothetical protein